MNGWRNVFTDRSWSRIFNIGIIIKVINGTLELIASCLIFFFNKNTLINLFFNFSKEELLEDPNDKLIGLINTWLEGVSTGTQTFISVYLVIHGLLNIFLFITWRQYKYHKSFQQA